MPDLQAAKAEYERVAALSSVGRPIVDAADALIATYEAELLRRDSAPVICPDIRGVRCPAYRHGVCAVLGDLARVGQPCPCVKEGR